MTYQSEDNSKWETALGEGLVWACIAFTVGWVVFFVALCLVDAETLRILFLPSVLFSDYLISKDILSNENMMGSVLITLVAPLVVIGFITGAFRGFYCGASAMCEKRGCLLTSFFVLLATLAGVILILVF